MVRICKCRRSFFRFTDPLKFGDYPKLLKEAKGDVLPAFSPEEAALVKGSTDFLA